MVTAFQSNVDCPADHNSVVYQSTIFISLFAIATKTQISNLVTRLFLIIISFSFSASIDII